MPSILPLTQENIEKAATALRAGKLVAFPTETVYGLGADSTNDKAVAKIYEAKNRPSFNPLIVHLPDIDGVRRLAEFSPLADRLAAKFWPGAISFVLPRKPGCLLSKLVSAGLPTFAARVPAKKSARELSISEHRDVRVGRSDARAKRAERGCAPGGGGGTHQAPERSASPVRG